MLTIGYNVSYLSLNGGEPDMVGYEKYRTILEGKLVAIDKILGKQKYMAGDVSVDQCHILVDAPLKCDTLVPHGGRLLLHHAARGRGSVSWGHRGEPSQTEHHSVSIYTAGNRFRSLD
jgi:hypothetical protein